MQGYLRSQHLHTRGVFHLFFRKLPFAGGYAIAAGLEAVMELLADFRFAPEDVAYLATLRSDDGSALFGPDFLAYVSQLRLSVDIDAMPEGTLAFANEPLLRVSGPLIEAQLLESALLNHLNFQTLIATKASRVCTAAQGQPVLEFGMRRAHGADGALSASRAAFIGGCVGTSNVLAGQRFGIPVRGTHAHSWVMAFDDERSAFQAYAEAMPNNCLFLVDTYESLQGVRHAIEVGEQLRRRGKKLAGIRIDSGDLAWLSIEARKLLDAAGFRDAVIVGSNDLDEYLVASLKQQGAAISVWGVGTRLVTAYDQPALGGVYKLAMIGPAAGPLEARIKISEQASKISNPGVQQVRRFARDGKLVADAIYDEQQGCAPPTTIIDPLDVTRRRVLDSDLTWEDLLEPVMRGGKRVHPPRPLAEIRAYAQAQLQRLDPTSRRLTYPHEYPVGLTRALYDERMRLIKRARNVPEP